MIVEAYTTLGISFMVTLTPAIVNAAWKAKLRTVHPDKNQGSAASTALTQKYNNARDTLLRYLQKPEDVKTKRAMDEEYERRALEKDKELAAAKAAAAAAAAAAKAAADAAKAKAATDGVKKRRQREPGSRVHRRLGSHEDGKSFLDAVRQYFLETYRHAASPGCRVLVSDVLAGFIKYRPSTTPLESNLFQRHSKRMFIEAVPGISYSKYKDKRCFVKVIKAP